MKNLLVGQSGGPTAAINATLAGVISAGINSDKIGTVFGCVNGIEGVLKDNLMNLSDFFADSDRLEILKQTPSAFLGSCRYKVSDKDIPLIVKKLVKNDIGYFCYIGGNDSMDTVLKLKNACSELGIKVIGVPKTIDNDLVGTDHCPGFGSAAKYIATTVSEIGRDASCYDLECVTIVEIMGRNAGWLAASSALARMSGDAPELIYLPEVTFDEDKFLNDVKAKVDEKKAIVVAVSEGIKNADGSYVAEQKRAGNDDKFGHSQLGGAGKYLELLIKERFGIKARSIELNTPQRCASHIASKADIDESVLIGAKAVEAALGGESGKMMCYKRADSKEYAVEIHAMDIEKIANAEKKIPKEFIAANGCDVTEAFIEYAYPLMQGERSILYNNGLPVHVSR